MIVIIIYHHVFNFFLIHQVLQNSILVVKLRVIVIGSTNVIGVFKNKRNNNYIYGLYFYYTIFWTDERSKNINTYFVLYNSHQKQSKFGQHSLKIYGSETLTMQKYYHKSFFYVILVWGQKGYLIFL